MSEKRENANSLSKAAMDVLAERRRQVEAEGWTAEHDDAWDRGELTKAAMNYAATAAVNITLGANGELEAGGRPLMYSPYSWPWAPMWFKSGTVRRMLVKAAALILAEIERLDRKHDLSQGAEQNDSES